MRITSKGQVTIPRSIRERFGLLPHTDVDFVADGGAVRIVKAGPENGDRRRRLVLRGLRGRATVSMSTDEILSLTRDA